MTTAQPRHLVLVVGDQLNQDSAAFDGFDTAGDAVWMAEVAEEGTIVWPNNAPLAVVLSAMRHFRDALLAEGLTVHYGQLSDAANSGNFRGELTATTGRLRPQRLIWVEPGEWRVQTTLESTARALGVGFEVRPDRHFFCSREEFARHAGGESNCGWSIFTGNGGAGRLPADQGHTVTLLEKGRGCGGRYTTKRWEGYTVDHGAQYFTMRHPEFSAAVQRNTTPPAPQEAALAEPPSEEAVEEPGTFTASGSHCLSRAVALSKSNQP